MSFATSVKFHLPDRIPDIEIVSGMTTHSEMVACKHDLVVVPVLHGTRWDANRSNVWHSVAYVFCHFRNISTNNCRTYRILRNANNSNI